MSEEYGESMLKSVVGDLHLRQALEAEFSAIQKRHFYGYDPNGDQRCFEKRPYRPSQVLSRRHIVPGRIFIHHHISGYGARGNVCGMCAYAIEIITTPYRTGLDMSEWSFDALVIDTGRVEKFHCADVSLDGYKSDRGKTWNRTNWLQWSTKSFKGDQR